MELINTHKTKIIAGLIIAVFAVQGYYIYSLKKQVADFSPILVEAYNGQNYLGKVLYEVGILDKNADGTGVIINPALPLRSAQQPGVTPQ